MTLTMIKSRFCIQHRPRWVFRCACFLWTGNLYESAQQEIYFRGPSAYKLLREDAGYIFVFITLIFFNLSSQNSAQRIPKPLATKKRLGVVLPLNYSGQRRGVVIHLALRSSSRKLGGIGWRILRLTNMLNATQSPTTIFSASRLQQNQESAFPTGVARFKFKIFRKTEEEKYCGNIVAKQINELRLIPFEYHQDRKWFCRYCN